MNTLFKAVLTCTALFVSSSAMAQKAGDNIISGGLASINPHASLGPLTSTGPAAVPFNATTAGATASIASATTVSLGWLHMFSDHLGSEVTIGVPPKLTVDVQLVSGSHPGAASAKALTPTAIGKYFFGTSASQVRPYLGLGVTHASFSSVKANTGDPLVSNLAGSGASLSSSWAPVYNAGISYNINERWSINGSITYIPVKTTATFQGAGAGTGTTTSGRLKINPTDYVIRVGYKF